MKRYIKSSQYSEIVCSYEDEWGSEYQLHKDRNGKYFIQMDDGFIDYNGTPNPRVPDEVQMAFAKYFPGTYLFGVAIYNEMTDEYVMFIHESPYKVGLVSVPSVSMYDMLQSEDPYGEFENFAAENGMELVFEGNGDLTYWDGPKVWSTDIHGYPQYIKVLDKFTVRL